MRYVLCGELAGTRDSLPGSETGVVLGMEVGTNSDPLSDFESE